MTVADPLAEKKAESEGQSGYRWVILGLAWLALLMSFVDRLAWANVAVQVGGSLGMQVASLGEFVTAFYVGYVASNAFGGVAIDWIGPRRMIGFSLLPLGLATFAFGYTDSVIFGLALQFAMGLAAGADFSACVKLIATWFDFKSRGLAMGLLTTASSIAVVATNASVPSLAKAYGWTGVYQSLGAATLIAGALCFLTIRDATRRTVDDDAPPNVAALFRNRDLVLLAIVGFGALWGTWGFAFWANALMIKGYGIAPIRAGFITASFGIGAIISKPLIGLLSDLLGGRRKALLVACFAMFTVMLLVFGTLKTETQFLIAAPILGVSAFVYTPLVAAMVAEISGPRLIGSAYGISNAFWQLGTVLVPLVVGQVFQASGSFYAAFVALAVGPLIATLFMTRVHEARRVQPELTARLRTDA